MGSTFAPCNALSSTDSLNADEIYREKKGNMSSPTITPATPALSGVSGLGLAECIRHSEFWFSDGDIVLVTKSTGAQNVHLFRVHKIMLELASPVFRKSLSENNNNQESLYDGARTICVSRTGPDILEFFLRFLYNP